MLAAREQKYKLSSTVIHLVWRKKGSFNILSTGKSPNINLGAGINTSFDKHEVHI